MKNDPLDELLDTVAKTPLPRPPVGLESRVWREIRARRAREAENPGWWAELAGLWGQMHLASAALATALVIGVFMGHQGARVFSTSPARTFDHQTGDSLGLRVFSAEPPTLPSTLLAQQP